MEARDLIVTPAIILIVYIVAYLIRPKVTDEITRAYFMPALTVKIVGAISVGLIYQFYYGGGDTFNYHTHGSRHVWEALMHSPGKWLKLVFGDGEDQIGIYKYSARISFWGDHSSYAVVRLASIFDLFTFSTYSATATLFAVFSFAGMWLLFLTFYERYQNLRTLLAIAIFFVPSVFFWGSGLLKDTITLGCLGFATYSIHAIFVRRRFTFINLMMMAIALFGLYHVKLYILLVFLPSTILWIFVQNLELVRNNVARMMLYPSVVFAACVIGYFALIKASEDNPKYAVNAIARTAQITAYDIRYYTGRDAGSGYTLGELDGTFGSMLRLAPQAINVSLFRPYVWEVSNPLMLLSAFESMVFLIITIIVLVRGNVRVIRALVQPDIFFSLLFSITFAFAVGVSTYNFGTLVRYKIPLMPFFAVALILVYDYLNKERKFGVLEAVE